MIGYISDLDRVKVDIDSLWVLGTCQVFIEKDPTKADFCDRGSRSGPSSVQLVVVVETIRPTSLGVCKMQTA